MLSIKRYPFEVIDLYDSNGKRRSDATDVYEALKKMSGNRCSICQRIYTEKNILTIEHVKPQSMYPNLRNEHTNLLGVCKHCNNDRINNIEVVCPTSLENLQYELYVAIDGEIKVHEGSQYKEKLEDTIKSYKLNRSEYKKQRENFRKMLMSNKCIEELILKQIKDNKLDENINHFPSIVIQELRNDDIKKMIILKYYDRSNFE